MACRFPAADPGRGAAVGIALADIGVELRGELDPLLATAC
jgi:hypothetical protein